MNRMQFMVHVAYQQQVTECRAALTDAKEVFGGRLAHLELTEQADKLAHEWYHVRLAALKERQNDKLWGLGLLAQGLP